MTKNESTLSLKFLAESISRKFFMPESMDKKTIGLELELLAFKIMDDGRLNAADIINEDMKGSFDLLYANSLCSCSMFSPDQKLDIPRLNSESGGIITFEPGGQVEYSSSVEADLGKVISELIVNVSELENILAKERIKFLYGGINPWQSVEEVGLKMRKPRYRAMNRYFENIGPHGQQMMRLSASLQVNLDFGDPETAVKRWLAANLLSPVFCALFGNTPFFSNGNTGMKSYRTQIWRNLDNSRTGFPHLRHNNSQAASPVEHYLEFALNASVFTLPDESGCLGYCENGVSFKSWLASGYNSFYPTIEDWETHLTTLFPEVRSKGFLECRFIDGQSKPCWPLPAILMTALIYDEEATGQIISLLSPHMNELDKMLEKASFEGPNAFPDLCRQVFEIGLNTREYGVHSDLLEYCERFYKHFTLQSQNPADALLKINEGQVFTAEQYYDYEDRLFDIIQPPSFLATKDPADLAKGCDCRMTGDHTISFTGD
jgi:glutamate--cysteine ligase